MKIIYTVLEWLGIRQGSSTPTRPKDWREPRHEASVPPSETKEELTARLVAQAQELQAAAVSDHIYSSGHYLGDPVFEVEDGQIVVKVGKTRYSLRMYGDKVAAKEFTIVPS